MSSKQSTTLGNSRKDTAREILVELEKSIARAEIMECFYQRKIISGDNSTNLILGKTQAELKQWRELRKYLNEVLDAK